MDFTEAIMRLRWSVADERKRLDVSRIIPGDWGKVGSGWLVQLLCNLTAGSAGRRQNSPVPLTRSRVSVTRKWNLATRSDEKPFRVESSSSSEFRAWVKRSYPEGIRLLLCISTGRATLADSINRLKPPNENHRKVDKRSA